MRDDNECPECGGRMVSRKNNATGQRFWGCINFPSCRGTRNTDGEARKQQSDDVEQRSPSERARANDRARWRNQ